MAQAFTKENENFFRLTSLLLDIGREVLAEVFESYYIPKALDTFLEEQRVSNTIDNLSDRNVITQEQYDLLYPIVGNADLASLDITLLYCLLRNLNPNKRSGDIVWTAPESDNVSVEADIGRIRTFRNILFGHAHSTAIADARFQSEWECLQKVLERLIQNTPSSSFSVQSVEDKISHALQDPLEPKKYDSLVAMLQQWQNMNIPLKLDDLRDDISRVEEKVERLSLSGKSDSISGSRRSRSRRSISSMIFRSAMHAPPLPRDKKYHLYFSCMSCLNDPMEGISQQQKPEVQLVKTAIQKLESDELAYTCCYPDRDFCPGKLLFQEMIDSISRSLRVVIVLHKNYFKSFSLFESQFDRLQTENVPIIPLVLDNSEIPEKLKPYCLLYPNNDRQWWKKFLKAIRGKTPALPEDKTDHVFIIHSNARRDIEWVQSLIQVLEAPENFLRCTSAHKAGLRKPAIKNTMVQNIEQAMTVIVVLTQNFQQIYWNEYKDLLMDKDVYLVCIMVDPNSYRPLEIEDNMYIDATLPEDIWQKQLLETLLYEDKTDFYPRRTASFSSEYEPDYNPVIPPPTLASRRTHETDFYLRRTASFSSEYEPDYNPVIPPPTLASRRTHETDFYPRRTASFSSEYEPDYNPVIPPPTLASRRTHTNAPEPETPIYQQLFTVELEKHITFDKQLKAKSTLCFGTKCGSNHDFKIQNFDVTIHGQIIICLRWKEERKYMLYRIDSSGSIIWTKKLKHEPVAISCTDKVICILSRNPGTKRRPEFVFLQAISFADPTLKVHVHKQVKYKKCYCMLALNSEMVLVSYKGNNSVQTVELESGRCLHTLKVQAISDSIVQTPRRMALSSDALLVVTNTNRKIYCYARSKDARGMFDENCLWITVVSNISSIASIFNDITVVLSDTKLLPSDNSTLVLIDKNGNRVYEKVLKKVHGPSKMACGPNGEIVVLHKEARLLTMFTLCIIELERL